MKRVISVLLILIFVLLSGCSNQKANIEKCSWEFSRISVTENDSVVFCSENNKLKYDGAKTISLDCSINNGKITIKNIATDEEWVLEYKENKSAETNNTEGSVYTITYHTEPIPLKGYASTGITSKNDIDDDRYLIFTLGGYSLYFIEKSE